MLFMMCIGAPPYEYPTEQNAAFRFIISGKLSDVLRHWRRLRLVTVEQLDLMEKIFKPEKERITMDEILAHPFVDLKRKPLFQPRQPKRRPNYANQQNYKQQQQLRAPYNGMSQVQEEKENTRNAKAKNGNTTVVTTRKNNDNDDNDNNNSGSSSGNNGGGGNNNGGDSSGGNAGGGSNNDRSSGNDNNSNNQNSGQQHGQQNSDYVRN